MTQARGTERIVPRHAIVALAIVALAAAIERLGRRPAICRCGRVRLWAGGADGPDTSQMIRDGLALNILMLVHPVAAIRVWQAGG